jgi:hypothetical protein
VRERLALALLAVLPVVALAPAWWEAKLVSPGDGAALHYPLRAAVFQSYRRGELPSWNPAIFSGTPLLAAYRGGALYPPMLALAPLPSFLAFQALVILSLSAAGVLVFVYLRRLGAAAIGAYVGGLSFALGPYLVGHLDDSATIVAAPLLPLALIALEAHVGRASVARAGGLAAAFALLLLAGSPEAARAGFALVVGRLVVAHALGGERGRPSLGLSALAVLAGFGLAAPQLVPTWLAAREAGRALTGLASHQAGVPGLTGLVLRYVSATPAPALVVAALPLLLTETPVRAFALALALCLGLQWGRGPLSAPGALALVFDLALAILAGLSLSAQWSARREALGRRLRAYFLFAALASAAALSIAAAALGPLPETLAGAVGLLALAMILYVSLAESRDGVVAGVWLIPFTVSFLLQPHGQALWLDAPTREQLESGTATSRAVEAAMGAEGDERVLTLVRDWPRQEADDLAFANLALLRGRRSANGYDPMVPLRSRAAYDGMGVGGTLPGGFFRSEPARLDALGVRFVQVPAAALSAQPDAWGLGDTLDTVIDAGAPRFYPVPVVAATELRLASSLSDAVQVPQGQPVASVTLRLASGRAIALALHAGLETAEWAWDRPDVRSLVAHEKAPVLESWPGPGGGFPAHRYQGILRLPGRFYLDGIGIERLPGAGRFTLSRMALVDTASGRFAPVSLASSYVSDLGRFRELAATPAVRLYEVSGSLGRAFVVPALRALASDEAVVQALRYPGGAGIDLRREALVTSADAAGVALPKDAHAARATVSAASLTTLDVRAEGPGVLVVPEGWDAGWSAAVDAVPARILRVNQASMAVVLQGGVHRITFRHRPRGFTAGLALASLSALALGAAAVARRPA